MKLAAQIGANDVVYYDMDTMPTTVDQLLKIKDQINCTSLSLTRVRFSVSNLNTLSLSHPFSQTCRLFPAHGLRLSVIEGGPAMDKVVTGEEGRDEQIEAYCDCIRMMGEAGVPVLCYNFMPPTLRVVRNSYEKEIRGGALSSYFDVDGTPTSRESSLSGSLQC